MTEEEFAAYLAQAVPDYADELARSGAVEPEDALERAQKDYAELLPEGLRSKNQHLFTLTRETLGAIGVIWFQMRERHGKKSAFLYDIELREDLRGQGLGRRALELLDEKLRELGARSVGLNVSGYNHAARALYEKTGYQITRMEMKKELG